ncbi:uncharacterized protein PRCAT00000877001 [Priceomyces carsonii]|uniref:uncharacterized protein n=1 Tax=Priceomyces carsonii TaxID=28549 RepID=UPI002ED81A3C|nr:unnamed protein product [Priceomyces carsonii]
MVTMGSVIEGYSSDSESGFELSSLANPSLAKFTKIPDDVGQHTELNEVAMKDNAKKNFGGVAERRYFDGISSKLASDDFKDKKVSKAESKRIKRRRINKRDPEDLNYLGPWAKLESEEDEKIIINADKEDIIVEENRVSLEEKGYVSDSSSEAEDDEENTSEFVGSSQFDYLGRSYMHVPKDIGISLTKDVGSIENFVPKKVIYTFNGHLKGVNKLEFFPKSGHLLLSGGNDGKIKLWSLYGKRELLRIYSGHDLSVKDVTFNSTGTQFLSCSFDKRINLWDTETGRILKTIRVKATPNALKFNPNNENEFLVGLANRNIEHYDLTSSDLQTPIQVYDHHLGAINSLLIIENGSRFMSTSDDKSVKFWDWQINIPVKSISDPSLHSMPCSAIYPGCNYIALQNMDNSIKVIQGHGKYRFNKKKVFRGHNVAGYGIELDISPDGKIIMSGDSKGNGYFWDWKTTKLIKKLPVSNKLIKCIRFHPQESSKVIMAGASGEIFYCD